MSKVRSCVTEKNFAAFLSSGIVSAKVDEAPNIEVNNWAWNDTYKSAHINDGSNVSKAVADINLGFVKAGELIRLSAEFMNISGVKGKIYLDVADNDTYTEGYANAIIYQSSKVGEFEETTITFVTKKDGYYKAGFGLLTADMGEYYMRNCYAIVNTIADIDAANYKQVVKTFNIKTSATGVFERDTRFGVDDFTVTVNTNYIVVTFAKPFTYSSARPIVTVGEDSTSGAYKIRTTAQQVSAVTVQLFNVTTNALVDHTTIPAGVYFSLTAIGHDLI